ncbi:MAG TPA: AsmA family protein [Steroidobacteraceae bacterium]|nr:AsmA family protein [Steroidobacteraceae bacterium]
MVLGRKSRSALKWTGVVVGALIAAVLLTLAFIDWNALKGPIEQMASAHSGRTVKIDGPLDVHLWSLTPRASVSGLTVGNPPWEPSRPMMHVDRLDVQLKLLPLLKGEIILPRVELVRPNVYLHREPSGRANWTFKSTRPSNAPAGRPPKLPAVRDFLIQSGRLTIHDEILHLQVDGTLQAHEKESKDDPHAFRIQGKGTINEQPFRMEVTGGPLVNLDPDRPYPFDMRLAAGEVRASANGVVQKPFDLGHLQLNARATGGDLADLYYLTQLAMPNSPPFDIAAHIERNVKVFKATKIAGTLGKSDVSGELTLDASRKRPTLRGELTSKRLRMRDLVASVGAEPKTGGSLQKQDEKPKPSKEGATEKAPANARLFPTARLQVNRVRAMDADVRYRAQAIEAGSVPLKQVAFHITLDDGLLALTPFEFEMPEGKISGTTHIDARGKVPQTRLDVRLRDLKLDQFKSKKAGALAPLDGTMQGRAVLSGHGDSVHDMMASANGRLSLVLPHGEVTAAFPELTGINVARGIGLLMKGLDDKAEIRCGVAEFSIDNGTMSADRVVFDTKDVRITGRGEAQLGTEALDFQIKGEPKHLRFTRVRTPIEIGGHLRKPSIGIDVGKTVAQGAIATALGAALTPFAAILAFVDPGLAKDANCAQLLETSDSAKPKAPDASRHAEAPEPNPPTSSRDAAAPAQVAPSGATEKKAATLR